MNLLKLNKLDKLILKDGRVATFSEYGRIMDWMVYITVEDLGKDSYLVNHEINIEETKKINNII